MWKTQGFPMTMIYKWWVFQIYLIAYRRVAMENGPFMDDL
jgi:hypothetical protein